MNREDLIKKLKLARVGSRTQTYNDVVLTLTKEETLELLKYIEKLEKLIWKKVEELVNEEYRSKELYDKNIELKQENQKLKEKNKKWQELFGRDLCEVLGREMLLEENTKLKKVCHLLLYKRINIDFLRESKNVDAYNEWISNLMNYSKLTKKQYELLKRVFESVGDSDE